jgi:hypothetical protein
MCSALFSQHQNFSYTLPVNRQYLVTNSLAPNVRTELFFSVAEPVERQLFAGAEAEIFGPAPAPGTGTGMQIT